MAENNISEAIEYARALLLDSQQRLPDELASLVEDAVNAWGQDHSELARQQLNKALTFAHATGYL